MSLEDGDDEVHEKPALNILTRVQVVYISLLIGFSITGYSMLHGTLIASILAGIATAVVSFLVLLIYNESRKKSKLVATIMPFILIILAIIILHLFDFF